MNNKSRRKVDIRIVGYGIYDVPKKQTYLNINFYFCGCYARGRPVVVPTTPFDVVTMTNVPIHQCPTNKNLS